MTSLLIRKPLSESKQAKFVVSSVCTDLDQVEQGTFFGRLQEKNQLHLPAEADSAEMYQLASQILQNHGYEHYEISNYAKPGLHITGFK